MRVLIGVDCKNHSSDKDRPVAVFIDQLKSISFCPERLRLICHLDSGVNTMLHVPEINQELFMEIVKAISTTSKSYVLEKGVLREYV